jgi:hypothetical protein
MKKHLLGYVLLLGLLLSSPLRAFISPDPEGHVASMDLYSYCNGDPVNQYDADGRIGKGAATGIALGGFGQYENTTQQIAGLVGQVGSYFIPGMQGYSAARDITFSGFSASKAAYNLAQPKGFNLSNGSELLFSAAGLIPGVGGVGSALRGESSAVFQEFRQTISLGAEKTEGDFTRVGRWMSQAEHDAMVAARRVQESTSLRGVTSVTSPPNAATWARQTEGTIFTEFDVPSSVLRGGGSKIYGPNSIFGPKLNITEMPPALNIQQTASKWPQ